MATYDLLCLYIDHHGERFIGMEIAELEIAPGESIAQLENAVKKIVTPYLDQFPAGTLKLWKPLKPPTTPDELSRDLVSKFARNIRFPDPIPDIKNSDVQFLDPSRKISWYWPERPEEDQLHIIIRVPPLGPVLSKRRYEDRAFIGGKGEKLDKISKPASQAALVSIYETLWGHEDDDILEISSERVPDVDGILPDESSTAIFYNLNKIIGSLDEKFPLCRHFLIREEYMELYNYLNDQFFQTNLLLLGHPGINTKLSWQAFLAANPNLYDRDLFILTDNFPSLYYFGTYPALVASSSQPAKHQMWENLANREPYVIQTWTWNEVYHARKFMTLPYSTAELREAFKMYGGSPRNLLQQRYKYMDNAMLPVIRCCDDIEKLFPAYDDFQDDAKHFLVRIEPEVNEDGNFDRRCATTRIASQHVLELILKHRTASCDRSIEEIFQRLLVNRTSLTLPILFEATGPRSLLKLIARQPLKIRSLDSGNQVTLDLRHIQTDKNFDQKMLKLNLNPTWYYHSQMRDLAGIHAFVFEQGTNGGVVAIKFTVSKSSCVSPRFLEQLWKAKVNDSNTTNGNRKWKLIFVVPKEIASKYSVQPWTPMSAQDLWEARVEQYVLGIEKSKLMRV